MLPRAAIQRIPLIPKLRRYPHRVTFMMEDPRTIPRAIRLILIARFLERVADHATDIAEIVIFMVDSKIVRHSTRGA